MVIVTINKEKYTLTDNPSRKVVRTIKQRQRSMLMKFIQNFKDEIDELKKQDTSFALDDAINYLMTAHPIEFGEYTTEEEDFADIAAISIATNKLWDVSEFDDIGFKDYEEMQDKCLEILGGDVNRFFGISTETTALKEEIPNEPNPLTKKKSSAK